MSHDRLLSLPAAILININIMMGVGIFINTVELSNRAGFLGAFLYPVIGCLIVPLIICIACLIKIHPAGGFYIFGADHISPLAGFISTWSYFTGKLASAILMIHVAVGLLQKIFLPLQLINYFVLDLVVLSLFIALNSCNIRTGTIIQMMFLSFKLIPVLTIIAMGFWYWDIPLTITTSLPWQGVISSLPLVLFAAMGFEATVSLSGKIQNAARNGPRAIYYSFVIVMLLIFLFQLNFFSIIIEHLQYAASYLHAFPVVSQLLFNNSYIASMFVIIMHCAIAFSALGGSYGILFSNSWNLYTLAQHDHVFGARYFTKLSKWGIPTFCVLLEGLICLLFLCITAGAAVPLQQISALSSVIAYTISIFALLQAWRDRMIKISFIIPLLGLFSCLILFGSCVRGFMISGLLPLSIFLVIGASGLYMYFIKQGGEHI